MIVFGLSFQFANDVLISINFVGKAMDETIVSTFIQTLVPSVFTLITSGLMFLFILGSSFVYPSLLRDPLLGVTLTRPISRAALFFSKFMGVMALVTLNVMLFSIVVWFILFLKTNGFISNHIFLSGFSFCFEFLIIFALCSLLAMIVESSTGVALLGLALYFWLGPVLADSEKAHSPLINVVSFMVPPIGALSLSTKNIIILGDQIQPSLLLASIPHIAISLILAFALFQRRDLR
ncbi:MAG: ABC transporter permease subunit [Ignavibacteriales bacterium]|nr:ABC transporter permease subunit [Ignavibacteriales bacterium]